VIGAGPAGLFFATCLRRRLPASEVTILEQRDARAGGGWGVVLARKVVADVAAEVPELAESIGDCASPWDQLHIHHCNRRTVESVPGYYSMARETLVDLLMASALRAGAGVQGGLRVEPDSGGLNQYDLIVAADGASSRFRLGCNSGGTASEPGVGRNYYAWFGVQRTFDAFQFFFRRCEAGWIWAHVYPDQGSVSTFIVECHASTWQRLGLGDLPELAVVELLERIFSPDLEGASLVLSSPGSRWGGWQRFRRVPPGPLLNDRTYLIGDAACTLHFSIGSGIRKAFADGSALAKAIAGHGLSHAALGACETSRLEALRELDRKSRASMRWFEGVSALADLPHNDFVRSLMSRAGNGAGGQGVA
jgi:anthraniloyl-CoA monooxygenase